MIDHLLFLTKTATNLEGMYIYRKNNFCSPLATKHSLEIFSEFKEIKQRNEVVEKHKRPQKQRKTVEKKSSKITKIVH